MKLFNKNKNSVLNINKNENKNENKIKKIKRINKYNSLFSSAITTVSMLIFIMLIFLFIPSNVSNGEESTYTKKYVYEFYLGQEEYASTYLTNYIGTAYTYRIYTTATYSNNKLISEEISDEDYSTARTLGNWWNTEEQVVSFLDDNSLMEYILNIQETGPFGENRVSDTSWDKTKLSNGYDSCAYDTNIQAHEIFKKLLFACVDDGHTITAKVQSGFTSKYYQYVGNDEIKGTGVADYTYPDYYWYSWNNNKENKNFRKSYYSHESEMDPLYCTKADGEDWECWNFLYNMKIDNGDVLSLFNFLNNNKNIIEIVSNHIEKHNNVLGFNRRVIEEDDNEGSIQSENTSSQMSYPGTYSYKIKEDSIDYTNGSEIVEIYYNENGTEKHVYSFLYYKGGEAGLVEDDETRLITKSSENSKYILKDKNYVEYSDNSKQMYQCITNYSDTTGSSATNPLGNQLARLIVTDPNQAYAYLSDYQERHPDIDNDFDGDGKDDGYLFYSKNAYKEAINSNVDIDSQYFSGKYFSGKLHAYAATKENDNVAVLDFQRAYINNDTNYNGQNCLIFGDPLTPAYSLSWNHEETSILGVTAHSKYTIPISELDSYFKNSTEDVKTNETMDCGNWHLVKYSDYGKLVAYNDEVDVNNGEEQCYFIMQFEKGGYFKINTEYYNESHDSDVYEDSSYKLHLKLNCDYTSEPESLNVTPYLYTDQSHLTRYGAFLSSGTIYNNQDTADYSYSQENLITNMMVTICQSNQAIILKFYDSWKSDTNNRGTSSSDFIDIDDSKCLIRNNEENIVSFDITSWIKEFYSDYELEQFKNLSREVNNNLNIKILGETEAEKRQTEFLKVLFKYAKPVIMFLIFLMIIYTGIYSIMNNQDAKQRVLVKEKLKHILYAVILFACTVLILFLLKSFLDTSLDKVGEVTEQNIQSAIDIPTPDYGSNWFVNLIAGAINTISGIFEWALNVLVRAVVGGKGTDLNYVIFNQGVDVEDFDLSPFTESEWIRYMYGYRALEALAIALLAIAVIKFAVEMILNSGNSQKAADGKQTVMRILIAILVILLAPYGVRLLLLLFNYLVYLIPLRHVNIELQFADTGILGASATLMFEWTKFQIYLTFVVRKLMITFMLLLTPFVMGLWAISEKFRSVNLWIGELVTNSATQFAYALVLFISSFIIYTNQSDFVSLIIVMLFVKLADFFKDSLQGLVQKWGGIDETGTAKNLAGTMLSWGKKTINATKNISHKVGQGMDVVSNLTDPDKISNPGRGLRNTAMFLQGGLKSKWNMETKGDTLENAEDFFKNRKEVTSKKINQMEINAAQEKDNNILNEKMQKIKKGEYTKEDKEEVEKADYKTKQKIEAYEKAVKEERAYGSAAKKAKADFMKSTDRTDRLRRENTEELLDKYHKQGENHKNLINAVDAYSNKENIYDITRKELANKSADLFVTRQLNENGTVTEKAVENKCKSVMDQLKIFENQENFNGQVANTIRKEVEDALKSVNAPEETIANILGNNPNKFSDTFASDEKGNYGGANTPDAEEFIEERQKRLESLKKAFGENNN